MPDRTVSSFFGLGHLWRMRADQLAFYADMHVRHGDAVPLRLGPYRNWLMFHPDAVEAVLATEAAAFVRFKPIMRVLSQWNGGSLLISEGERWKARRRQVLPAFATRRLPGYGERIVARATVLLDAWQEAAFDGLLTTDTDRDMVALTLDIAAETLFGKQLAGRESEVGDAVAVFSDVAFRESTNPVRLPRWLPGQARKHWAMATMDRLVMSIVTERLAEPHDDRGDLLSMLTADGTADPVAVRDEVMTLLIAGHETTGALLSWASHLLATHTDVLDTLQAELAGVLENRSPSPKDLHAMPLLRAVVEETLRLYPPAYALFPRQAVRDVTVGGTVVRKGEMVQVVPYVTQRDPRWFPEPDAFRPARFLGEPTWSRYAYIPFGAGPRVCIGQAFGLLEAALILGTLLQRFTPMPADGAVVPEPRFSLRPRGGLLQRWRLRSAAGPIAPSANSPAG